MKIFYVLGYLLIALMTIIRSLKCQNGGVTILTRTIEQPYVFQFKCLCPYKYIGDQCTFFRGILCYIGQEQILKYDTSTGDSTLQFQVQCYLKKLKQMNSTIIYSNQGNSFYKLPLTKQQIEEQLNSQNYFLDQRYQIIWANDTTLFDQNGNLLRNQNDTRTDEQIINSQPHFAFNYSQYFLGVPLYNCIVSYQLSLIKFSNKFVNLPSPQVEFEEQKVNGQKKIKGKFNLKLQKQWEEYQVTKIQLQFEEYYGINSAISHKMSINGAKWRIFDKNFKKGQIISGDTSKFPGSIKILLIFILFFVGMWCARMAINLYRVFKNRSQKKYFEEQSNE